MLTQIDLWIAYQERGDLAARDLLVKEHLGLVYVIVKKLRGRFRGLMEREEMVSAGCLGLLTALRDFQRDRGLAFSTFAAPRIRGAILDEVRQLDPLTRHQRTKERSLSQARKEAEQRLGHRATPRDVADRAGIDLNTYWRWRQSIESATPLPLESEDTAEPGGVRIDHLVNEEPEIEDRLVQESEVRRLKILISTLNERERTVMALYYLEDLTLRQIGEALDLSDCRVSQIRARALFQLRKMLESSERIAA